ncbi:MAG: cysteine synthase family protein [Pseudomonadota bacterium]
MIYPSILNVIGHTPMVALKRFNPALPFDVYAKCEMFNPTLSIKDRIVLRMINDFERRDLLKPGGTIVEASSGNTGSSLAMLASVLGYKALITVPYKTSQEKVATMRLYGAKVVVSPEDVTSDAPEHYVNKAAILAQSIPNAVLLNQYDNPVNVETHFEDTAEEIWTALDGNIDCLVAAASSGGTITGVGRYLKQKKPSIQVFMPDPVGSVFYDCFYKHQPSAAKPYQVEGAGKDKVCRIHDFSVIDDVIQFTDAEAFAAVRQLAKTEGILAGGSAGGALSILEKLSGQLLTHPSPKRRLNVVVILADSGFKYLSKLSAIRNLINS